MWWLTRDLSAYTSENTISYTAACLTYVLSVPVEEVICCRLTSLQESLYKLLVASKASDCQLNEDTEKPTAGSLSFITQLKKLCNRKLIF